MKATLFLLRAKETLFNDNKNAIVLAESAERAINCMTDGSDSCWVSVEYCKPIGEMTIDDATMKLAFPTSPGGSNIIQMF